MSCMTFFKVCVFNNVLLHFVRNRKKWHIIGFWCDDDGKSREIINESPRDTNYNPMVRLTLLLLWTDKQCHAMDRSTRRYWFRTRMEYQSLYKTIKPGHPQQLTRAPLISRRFYSKLISNIGEIVIPHEYNISFVN